MSAHGFGKDHAYPNVRRMWVLYHRIEAMKGQPQTLASEIKLKTLETEHEALRREITAGAYRTKLLLMKAYSETGAMRVEVLGLGRIEGHPTKTGNQIQDWWNVCAEAESLASYHAGLGGAYI